MPKTKSRDVALPRLRRTPIELRALPDEGEGVFEAIVSVYGIPYSVGFGMKEQIEPACFDESLSANPTIPMFWSHQWNAGLMIGDATATSTAEDLRAKGQLWIDDPLGLRVWRGLLSGAIREWSIGFFAEAIEFDKDDESLEHITKGELIEASSVVRGANPETETVSVAALRSILSLDAKMEVTEERELVRRLRELMPELRRQAKDDEPPPDDETPPPAADIPAEHLSLLKRPAVRELLRSRLES